MKRFLLPLLTVGLFLHACGYSGGFLRDSVTRVQVNGPHFKIVQRGVSAMKDTSSVLCIVPTGTTSPMKDLMDELHQKANLKANQMFVNFRQDHSLRAFFIFVCLHRTTLSADVIEFSDHAFAEEPTVAPVAVPDLPAETPTAEVTEPTPAPVPAPVVRTKPAPAPKPAPVAPKKPEPAVTTPPDTNPF